MIKEERQVPTLRFREFDNVWKCETLGKYVIINSGSTPTDLVCESGNIPYFKVEQLNNSVKYQKDTPYFINDKNKTIPAGSLIFPKRGGAIMMNKIRIIAQDSFMDTNLMTLTAKDGINNEFLYYFLNKEDLSKVADTTSIPQINNKHIEPYKIWLPDLYEQIKIATFLSVVDARIGLLKKQKEQLELYKRGMMQQLFSCKVRFRNSQGKDYPEWIEQQLKDILTEHKVVNKNQAIKEIFSVAKHKGVINQLDHMGRSYAAENTSNYKVVYPYDIVYTKSPTSGFPFGIIKQNKTDRTGIVSVLYAVYKPVNKYVGLLLDAYFNSHIRTYNYLNPLVQKGAKNTMNIGNKAFLDGATIALPSSTEEQKKIADFLLVLDNKIDLCEREIANTENFKKGLFQQMFV